MGLVLGSVAAGCLIWPAFHDDSRLLLDNKPNCQATNDVWQCTVKIHTPVLIYMQTDTYPDGHTL